MISVGAVVGRGFVGVNNELWLFIGDDLRAGKFLGVLVENDHVTACC